MPDVENGNVFECIFVGPCVTERIIIIAVAATFLIISFVTVLYFYKRRMYVNAYKFTWKVPKERLKVIESKQTKARNRVLPSEKMYSKRRVIDSYAILGIAKAEFLCFKQNKKIKFTNEQMKALKEMRAMKHENLADFFGVCYNEDISFYTLYTLIDRASLEDFVRDPDFDFDAIFQLAFLNDILRGLQYLHKSRICYHGLLNIHTCLIDANWVLRMSYFGLTITVSELIEKNHLQIIEKVPQSIYVHVAPEHLKNLKITREYPKGSPGGDIYSFGIILYAMLYRKLPFEKTNIALNEVIEGIVYRNLRPEFDNSNLNQASRLTKMMDQCWDREPDDRPKLREIQHTINAAYPASSGNLVDQMLRMNEKYAENLERVVAERTAMLEEAQQQTDRLLCEILPPTIAARLKAGEAVIPRNYASVTVGFFQICNFELLMKACTPNQVVSFLNDSFATFDWLLRHYDAYKVETTGENYMVASGVPNENENRHVFIIADFSLRGIKIGNKFKSEVVPEWKFVLRIGFHTGPIAAGVIGLRSPRYCLFGDTVNFASRMQSTCNPNQIQISESTANLLKGSPKYRLTKRGIVSVKGKGDVNTYWLNEAITESQVEANDV